MDVYGLVGFPLGHSFSKKYFTEKFSRKNIEAVYLNFEIEALSGIQTILKEYPELKGFNVTIPHKQNILPYLNFLDEEARQIGAVNCVKVIRNSSEVKLSGYNTDAAGFRSSLLDFIPAGIRKALILGNGGAAKAVRYVLTKLGMEVITVTRTPRQKNETGYEKVPSLLASCRLIVNTTPLGTWPAIEKCPDIPYGALTSSHYLFDLVYNPEVTEFMKRGHQAGAQVHNGLEMLKRQAEEGWKIWQKQETAF